MCFAMPSLHCHCDFRRSERFRVTCSLGADCCTCLYAAAPTSGTKSTVGAQPAPVPASDVPELRVESEAQQRRVFPTTDFAFAFDANDFQTPGGSGSGLVRS